MKLSSDQGSQFDRDGDRFFPGQFRADEAKALTGEGPALYARREACNVRERRSGAVRAHLSAHLHSAPCARLAQRPRMVEPVMQLLDEPVSMHQIKINGKTAVEGDVWQWHQDHGTWLNDDQMPTERAMTIAIFLGDVNAFNVPRMFIAGSPARDGIDARHDLTTPSYPLWTVDKVLISQLVARADGKHGGIVWPTGPAGSMIVLHARLVHASASALVTWLDPIDTIDTIDTIDQPQTQTTRP